MCINRLPNRYLNLFCSTVEISEKILSIIDIYKVRPGKINFGSGQLIIENWSGGPVDFFLEPQPIVSKSYFSTSHKTRDPDSACIDMSVIAQK